MVNYIFKSATFKINLILLLLISVSKINASSKFYYAEQWYVIFNTQMKKNLKTTKKYIFSSKSLEISIWESKIFTN